MIFYQNLKVYVWFYFIISSQKFTEIFGKVWK